jgi:hypothetical protein
MHRRTFVFILLNLSLLLWAQEATILENQYKACEEAFQASNWDEVKALAEEGIKLTEDPAWQAIRMEKMTDIWDLPICKWGTF